jgi:hypothetical protein
MNQARPSANGNQLLESAFAQEMHGIYQRALSEAGYKATRFLHMLHDHGGLQAARMLIHAATVSEGYSALWERGRLDLTVEAMILDNARWHPLFSDDELTACERRLLDYGYVKRHP